MRLAGHGNWCGPGWTAGQYKDANQLTEEDRDVPAIDALDKACKEHDIQLHDNPENAKEINNQFVQNTKGLGIKAAAFGLLVENFGPAPATAKGTSLYNLPRWQEAVLSSGIRIRTTLLQ